jgi:hypothetical protein
VSLWDIVNRFHVADFAVLIEKLTSLETSCAQFSKRGEGGAVVGAVNEDLKVIVESARSFCASVGFEETESTAHILGLRLSSSDHVNVSHVESEARNLRESLIRESWFRVFIVTDKDLAGYVDNEVLFGRDVYESFPSARADIREAGNCLATGCRTATVFHLMRAAEYGLRSLARDRRIQLPKKGLIVELATWEEIIKELEHAETAIQGYPRTTAREAQFKFYHGAMMQFRAFKNKFRNCVMHTRDTYDAHQARSAFERVREFMQILASRISETKRTPEIWKGKKWTTIET